ncbi:MAG: protein,PAS protein,PAS protein [Firmicutes bacterium]|nr:protein,PAS protein,PAS protein [Bacillota bacterium]
MQPMQLIVDHMPYLAWMKDKDGKYVIVNRTFAEFCHKEPKEIIDKTALDIFAGEIAVAYKQLDDKVMKYKKIQYLDHIYREDETGSKWFDTCVTPVLDENGEISGTIGFSRKISKRKKLEIELKNKEIFLKTMLDTIPDLIFYKDINSIILGCNKACSEMVYGTSEENVIGKTILQLVKDDDLANNCLIDDQETFTMNKTLKKEEKIRLIDGRVLDVETEKTPFYNERGEVAGLIAVSRDITARKKNEQELRERELHIECELILAARMQKDNLPQPFAGKNVRVSSVFSPYHIVSGDLINYKWFEEQKKLCGYVVDVSGHGVATALQAATVKMMLDNRLLGGNEINEGDFQHINQRMMQYLSEESFAALMYFEFDFQDAILKVISGGVNFFMTVNPHECTLVPVFSCYLGIFEKTDVQTLTRSIKPGEIYCMMSDGLSDLIEIQGTKKLKDVAEYTSWLEIMAHSPDRMDDCSAICIEVLQENKKMNILHIENSEELEQAQTCISEFLEDHIPDAVMLEVAINEAVNNSFRMGGRVRVKLRRVGGRLIIRVKDNGPGFRTREVNDQLKKAMHDEEFDAAFDQLLLEESGRGILLMQMLCDRLIYNSKGNEVLMMKKVD